MTSLGSSSSVVMRAARPDDVEAIEALENASFQPPWSRAILLREMDDARNSVLVAQIGDDIVGYASGWTLEKEAELDRVAVSTNWRGQGIGTHLLDGFLNACRQRGATQVFLEVRVGNAAARRLYQSAGFVAVGRRPRYYDDGEDALILRLEI